MPGATRNSTKSSIKIPSVPAQNRPRHTGQKYNSPHGSLKFDASLKSQDTCYALLGYDVILCLVGNIVAKEYSASIFRAGAGRSMFLPTGLYGTTPQKTINNQILHNSTGVNESYDTFLP
jgi:hypothetical protein